MQQFVCVRIVQANALDLSVFSFDFDLTFAAFFLNADKTLYGRYGTRSSRADATKDMALEGLREAMQGALEIHRGYPGNKNAVSGKQAPQPRYPVPERYPSLRRFKPELDYEGQVVKSCIHCHQIRDAERATFRTAGKPIPDKLLYPWPMPSTLGLELDPSTRATVSRVRPGSTAAADGFRAGDQIVSLAGQPLLSIADMQWILHQADDGSQLTAQVQRGEETKRLTLRLTEGWRRQTDIGWRVSTWELRRMVLGGLVLEELSADDRREAGVADDSMALRVTHVGQYGAHAVAKRAGFKKGDVIVSFDGQQGKTTESALLTYGGRSTKPGQRVPVTVRRQGRSIELTLPIQ